MNTESSPTLPLDAALQQAIAHHQAGQLQDAERLYRAILQAQPDHPEANHNLDVHALTDRGDGMASGDWHIDDTHLTPAALVEAFASKAIAGAEPKCN